MLDKVLLLQNVGDDWKHTHRMSRKMENFCTDLLKSWVDRVLAPACRLNPRSLQALIPDLNSTRLIYTLGVGLFVHTCPRSTEKCSKFWANEHRYKAVEMTANRRVLKLVLEGWTISSATSQDCDPGRILLHCYVYIMRRIFCTYLY